MSSFSKLFNINSNWSKVVVWWFWKINKMSFWTFSVLVFALSLHEVSRRMSDKAVIHFPNPFKCISSIYYIYIMNVSVDPSYPLFSVKQFFILNYIFDPVLFFKILSDKWLINSMSNSSLQMIEYKAAPITISPTNAKKMISIAFTPSITDF